MQLFAKFCRHRLPNFANICFQLDCLSSRALHKTVDPSWTKGIVSVLLPGHLSTATLATSQALKVWEHMVAIAKDPSFRDSLAEVSDMLWGA